MVLNFLAANEVASVKGLICVCVCVCKVMCAHTQSVPLMQISLMHI